MCFSNVFSLAPEINDFFRCLRLWNFSTGGKATEWSTFLKTGPPKRTLYMSCTSYIYYIIPSLLTDFKISNFVTFSYSGSMKDNRERPGFGLSRLNPRIEHSY